MSFRKYGFRFAASLVVWGLFLGVTVEPVHAAGSLSLSPANGSGSQFAVQVLLDTGTDNTIETDVNLNYDPAILELSNISFGTLYPENREGIDNQTGELNTYSYFSGNQPTDVFKGTGVLATITFIGKKLGTSAVTINCVPSSTNDSNILRPTPLSDILNCQQVTNGSYTVTSLGGAGVTVTPTASVSPTPTRVLEIGSSVATATPTPVEELLNSGALTPTLTITLIGAILLMGSLVLFIW